MSDDKGNSMNDDFNIKSNLNTSLDMHKITVSEELIHRTLQAVRQQENEQAADISNEVQNIKNGNTGKGINKAVWYRNMRIVAGAAAAVIVLVAGVELMSVIGTYVPGNGKGSTDAPIAQEKADMATSGADSSSDFSGNSLGTTNDSSAQDTGSDTGSGELRSVGPATDKIPADTDAGADTKSFTYEDETTNGKAKEDTSLAASNPQSALRSDARMAKAEKSIATDQKEAPVTEVPGADDAGTSDNLQDSVQGITFDLTVEEKLSFQDILAVPSEQISAVKITDNAGGKEIILTQPEEIQSFYADMNQQQFIIGTQTPTMITKDTIVLTDIQGIDHTIMIADVVSISPVTGDVSEPGIYAPVDQASLLKLIAGYLGD